MTFAMVVRCLGVLAFSISAIPASSEPINANRFGLYVVVDDMDRARAFHEQLFGTPEVERSGLVGFNVAGEFNAVVSREIYASNAVTGDTMRAYIDVHEIETTFGKVQAFPPDNLQSAAVIVERPFRFFRIRDPDNNIVEFLSIDLAPSEGQ